MVRYLFEKERNLLRWHLGIVLLCWSSGNWLIAGICGELKALKEIRLQHGSIKNTQDGSLAPGMGMGTEGCCCARRGTDPPRARGAGAPP